MNEVTLPRAIVNQLLSHAQREETNEVCGLIAAHGGLPTRVFPIPNAARDKSHRFAMEPHAQIDAMRRLREAGESLFAIYHSHPDSPATPSATDLAEAAYPEALYLIISLNTEGVLEIRGFRLGPQEVMPVSLAII